MWEGRNSIYLAEKGFNVDAFDISEAGIKKLKNLSVNKTLNINAWVQNVEDYVFEKKYNLIISHGLFQFISKEVRDSTIEKMKENTKCGGYNIIVVFTDVNEPPEDLKPYLIGIFKEEGIKQYYKDWIIEEFQTYTFEDEHENNIKHIHAINKIIVMKPF